MSAATETGWVDGKLGDDVAEHCHSELEDKRGTLFLGVSGSFHVVSPEDAGLDEDDGWLVISRDKDGALFAVQLQAYAVPLPSRADRQQAVAALPDEHSCWVLTAPCGCPCGVADAARGTEAYAATEAEAWMTLYDDWGRAARDKAAGYRVGLMTHARYKSEAADLMLARCPHEEKAGQQLALPVAVPGGN